ncbi:MAG: hypothetical protein ACO3JL_20540, partial [Myxococcota bacterium]
MVTRGTKRSWRLFLPDGQAVPLGERRPRETCRVLYRGEVFRGVVEARAQRPGGHEPRLLFLEEGNAERALPTSVENRPRHGHIPAASLAESICERADPVLIPEARPARGSGRSLVPQLDPDSLFSDEGEPVAEPAWASADEVPAGELPAPPVEEEDSAEALPPPRATSSVASPPAPAAVGANDEDDEDLSLSDLSAVGGP